MKWTDLDIFTKAYLVAALWSSDDNSDAQGGDPLDQNYDLSDIAESSLIQAKADCAKFREMAGDWLKDWTDEQAGHDFWLTRNGHGAGFWDRYLENAGDDRATRKEAGDKLTKLCEQFRSLDPGIGDDGKIYFEG